MSRLQLHAPAADIHTHDLLEQISAVANECIWSESAVGIIRSVSGRHPRAKSPHHWDPEMGWKRTKKLGMSQQVVASSNSVQSLPHQWFVGLRDACFDERCYGE